MANELNKRQLELYYFLRDNSDDWIFEKEIAEQLYKHELDKTEFFIGSTLQRRITKDIQAINDCSSILAVIMFKKSKGVKIATEKEFYAFYNKRLHFINEQLNRLQKMRLKFEI